MHELESAHSMPIGLSTLEWLDLPSKEPIGGVDRRNQVSAWLGNQLAREEETPEKEVLKPEGRINDAGGDILDETGDTQRLTLLWNNHLQTYVRERI